MKRRGYTLCHVVRFQFCPFIALHFRIVWDVVFTDGRCIQRLQLGHGHVIDRAPGGQVSEQEEPPQHRISNHSPPVPTGRSQAADIHRGQKGHDQEVQVHLQEEITVYRCILGNLYIVNFYSSTSSQKVKYISIFIDSAHTYRYISNVYFFSWPHIWLTTHENQHEMKITISENYN